MSANAKPVLLNMSKVKPEEVRWLWENCVPLGKVTIFAGDPGLGKSLVALDLAARVTRDRRGVILLSAEDAPADTIRPRLDAARADVGHVELLKGVRVTTTDGEQERMLRLDRDIKQIAEAIRLHPDTDLVVIDPLSAYMGDNDSNNDESVRSILSPLAELAAHTGVAIVGIKHLNKDEQRSAMYRTGGSIGFVAAARVVWLFGRDPSNRERHLMALVKCNIGPNPGGLAYRIEGTESGSARVTWESASHSIGPEDILRPAAPNRESAVSEAKKWLADMLAKGSMPTTELEEAAKQAGLSWMSVRRAADELDIAKTRQGFGSDEEWIWSMP